MYSEPYSRCSFYSIYFSKSTTAKLIEDIRYILILDTILSKEEKDKDKKY